MSRFEKLELQLTFHFPDFSIKLQYSFSHLKMTLKHTNTFINQYEQSIPMSKNKRVTISINNDIDLNFRRLASSKMLFKTGWYSKAIEEAMLLWIEKEDK